METVPNRWQVGLNGNDIEAVQSDASRNITTIGVQYDHFGVGGAERVTAEIALGYRAIVYTNDTPTIEDQELPESVTRKVLPSENDGEQLRFNFWKHEVETERLGCVVYCSWVSAWAQFDCWAIKSLGAAFVYHAHNVFYSWFEDPIADYLARAIPWILRRSDLSLAIDYATLDFFRLYTKNAALITNPIESYLKHVDTNRLETAQPSIVWVGRISDEKRPYEAVQIMKRVHELIPDAHMTIIGGNQNPSINEPASIRRYAYQELGLPENTITFTGSIPNPYEYLRSADVYLMTSEYEGFPLTLAEAMKFSLPCVCYNLDFLVLMRDNPGIAPVTIGDIESAAQAIVWLLENDNRRRFMGQAAHAKYEQVCDIDYIKIWKQIVESLEFESSGTERNANVDLETLPYQNLMNLTLQKIKVDAPKRRATAEKISQLNKECDEMRRFHAQVHEIASNNARLNEEISQLKHQLADIEESRRNASSPLCRPISIRWGEKPSSGP